MFTNTGGKCFCLGHWLRTWRHAWRADESPTNRLTLFPIYLSLFLVSTLCRSGVCGVTDQRFHNSREMFEFYATKSCLFLLKAMYVMGNLSDIMDLLILCIGSPIQCVVSCRDQCAHKHTNMSLY